MLARCVRGWGLHIKGMLHHMEGGCCVCCDRQGKAEPNDCSLLENPRCPMAAIKQAYSGLASRPFGTASTCLLPPPEPACLPALPPLAGRLLMGGNIALLLMLLASQFIARGAPAKSAVHKRE